MDRTEEQLVSFALRLCFDDLSDAAIAATRLRLIDSLGVALASLDAPPVHALTAMLTPMQTAGGARLWGSGATTTPDLAALNNGTMVRYLDMNDAYTLTSTAHPSDNIAGMIALAEFLDRSLAELILAIVISYEVQCRFCDVAPFHQNGWDQPIVGAPAAALGAASLLQLDPARMRHAVSLAVTPNLPTYRTRQGELSMWKNMAGPNGARIGVQAAMMAAAGITAPEAAFDGPNGVWQQSLGERFDVPLPKAFQRHQFAIEQSDIKLYPVRNAIQLPVQLALELHPDFTPDKLERLTVWTDTHAFGKAAKDPALWQPTTRESADHSLPFCLAAALLDGAVGLETFERQRFLDADIRQVMDRISIDFDPDYSRRAPQQRACRLELTDRQGQTHTIQRSWSAGDPARQPDEVQVFDKFSMLARRSGKADAQTILDGLEQMSLTDSTRALVDLLIFPD